MSVFLYNEFRGILILHGCIQHFRYECFNFSLMSDIFIIMLQQFFVAQQFDFAAIAIVQIGISKFAALFINCFVMRMIRWIWSS